jgi:GAF domain-containing protein
MNADRPDVLHRLDSTMAALTELNAIFADEESLDAALSRIARNAVSAVPQADTVSITVMGSTPRTAAHTDESVLELDAAQYAEGEGPCLEAAQTRQPVRVMIDSTERRWPRFLAVAQAEGVRATLSIPLIVGAVAGHDGELVGSVNIYSRTVSAFDLVDEKLLCLYTDAASRAVTDAHRWRRTLQTVTQLEQALDSRSEIDQAKGALRVAMACTADEAFELLVRRSQRENVKLRDIAHQVIEDLSRKTAQS